MTANTLRPEIQSLVEYFESELPELGMTYSWGIPNISGFEQSGKSSYVANVALKKFFHQKWKKCSTPNERLALVRTIVRDWGQVRSNRDETLRFYAENANTKNPELPLKGVASYSKVLSIVDPDRYAIYDARVAACLNALQINRGQKNENQILPQQGLAFHYVPGRNNITGNSIKKVGFSQEKAFQRKALEAAGWNSIKRDDCYSEYLETLATCLQHLRQRQQFREILLCDLEMTLFCKAEKECKKALADEMNVRKPVVTQS